jgi:hypothetical protein
MVEVAGTGVSFGAVEVLYKAASGTEIHGVAATDVFLVKLTP